MAGGEAGENALAIMASGKAAKPQQYRESKKQKGRGLTTSSTLLFFESTTYCKVILITSYPLSPIRHGIQIHSLYSIRTLAERFV